MGSQKYENVGESQSVLVMINPMISPRTRRCSVVDSRLVDAPTRPQVVLRVRRGTSVVCSVVAAALAAASSGRGSGHNTAKSAVCGSVRPPTANLDSW
jgi:hypothetical protein